MGQLDFQHEGAGALALVPEDQAGLPLTVSIYADRELLRGAMESDARAAGLRVARCGDITELLEGDARLVGDAVLLDCPSVSGHKGGAILAALARLDMRAARTGAQLVVSTTLEALDDIFGCLDQANPVILVDPTRGERVIALGDILTKMSPMRLRELSEPDRMTLLRLTEQVGQIAERLEGLSHDDGGSDGERSAFSFEAKKQAFHGQTESAAGGKKAAKISLPDPRFVRQIIRHRHMRARFFEGELFADPAWDMLLDLTAARAEHKRVSVTSLCIAAGVPSTTALRWISQMVEQGILVRMKDDADKRRAFIALSDKAADGMARYFAEMAEDRD